MKARRLFAVSLAVLLLLAPSAASAVSSAEGLALREVTPGEGDVLPSCIVIPDQDIEECYKTPREMERQLAELAQPLSGGACVVKLYNWYYLHPGGGVITVYGTTGVWVNLSSSWRNRISSVDASGSCGVLLSDYSNGAGAQYNVPAGTTANSLGSMSNDANAYLVY